MKTSMSFADAKEQLRKLEESACRKECCSCDCLQGLLTQLKLDYPELAELVEPLQVSTTNMHSCLGCEPCPPGEVFTEYLLRQNETTPDSQETGEADSHAPGQTCCGAGGNVAEEGGAKSNHNDIRDEVRKRYAGIATADDGCCCSGTSCCAPDGLGQPNASGKLGYSDDDLASAPEGANMGLGCGNPQAIADLKLGETVLDLGSGGGFDCFLAARQVGETGRVIGVDMTADMISKARENADKEGYTNVEFRLGEIEHLPLADGSVDVILSNCVINLSPDKPQVYREAFRVLRPGGRLAISDVVALEDLPNEVKCNLDAHCGCIAGAATAAGLEQMLTAAGFVNVQIRVKEKSREFIRDWLPDSGLEEYVRAAVVEAQKSEGDR